MRRASQVIVIGGCTLLLLACVVGVLRVLPPIWPIQYQRAYQQWNSRHPRHYEAELIWADGWQTGHARVELRDNTFVSGTDLETGRPLEGPQRLAAAYYGSVDTLFNVVEQRIWPSLDWRIVVSRFHPELERRLRPCIPPLSSVDYDPQLGYPREVVYNNSWCSNTFYTYTRVHITRLTPLP